MEMVNNEFEKVSMLWKDYAWRRIAVWSV